MTTPPRPPIHIDLEPSGFPGLWADIVDPRYYSQNRWQAIADLSQTDPDAFVRELVVAWHLENYDAPDGIAKPLNDPATDDLREIPLGVYRVLFHEFEAAVNAELPKASSRPPSAT